MKPLVLPTLLLAGLGVATLSAAPAAKHRAWPKAATVTPSSSAKAGLLASAASQPLALVDPVPAAIRTSVSYSVAAETFDAGGATALISPGGVYALKDVSVGEIGALASSTAGTYTAKGGYAGQLYETQGLAVTSPAPSVNEGSTLPLGAAPLLDDGTLLAALAPGVVTWSVASGPLISISPSGLATAATVYQNTPATVRATSGVLSGTGALAVLNVNPDDYGSYAGDGLDDAWQVMYFGVNNPKAGPNVDADGTGQTNLFKYLAGLNPLDPTSRFLLSISPAAGQPGAKTLIFSPRYDGHTYTVQFTSSLIQPNWTNLANSTPSDNGTSRTVTDLSAGTAVRFYRVQVSLP